MDRVDFYFKQRVTENELDQAFDYAEQADRNLYVDAGFWGIFYGLGVTQNAVPNLAVKVGAGAAYDQTGARCALTTDSNVDCSIDHLGVATGVVTPGNAKWLSIFIEFDRAFSDPRTDGNGNDVWFQRNQTVKLWVKQGAEAVSPSPPALESNAILLADVLLTHGMTQITTSAISTARRQTQVKVAGSPYSLEAGRVGDALASMLAICNDLITGTITLSASSIEYAGGNDWLDGEHNSATDVESQIDKIINDLVAEGGADRIGCRARRNWISGRMAKAGSIWDALDDIIATLSLQTSTGGSATVGALAHSGSPTALSTGSVYSQIAELLSAVNARARLASEETWTAKQNFGAGVSLTRSVPSVSQPGFESLYATPSDTPVLVWQVQNIAGGNGTITRFYRDRYNFMITTNAERTISGQWQADYTNQPASMTYWHAHYGRRESFKADTTSAWSLWDENTAPSDRGYKYISFEPTDTFAVPMTDGTWQPIRRTSGTAADLEVTFPSVPPLGVIEVIGTFGCRNPTAASGVKVSAKAQVYYGDAWHDVPGSLQHVPWESEDTYAPGHMVIFGCITLPSGIHTNVKARIVTSATSGSLIHYGGCTLRARAFSV